MGFRFRKLGSDPTNETSVDDCDDLLCFHNCTSSSSSSSSSPCFKLCFQHCHDELVLPSSPPSHHSKLPTNYLTISLTVFTVLVLILGLYAYYARRRRNRSGVAGRSNTTETHDEFLDEEHGLVLDHHIWYINTVGLQPSIIDSIAVFKYMKGDGVVEGTECSVCLAEFENDDTLRLLPKCSHAFHIPCIDTWLRSHTNCPMCRAPIVSNTVNNGLLSSNTGAEVTVAIMEDGGESERETEGGSGTSHEDELAVENEGNSEVLQPVRRSVSLDSMAASRISEAIAGGSNSDNESAKMKESSLRIVSRRGAGTHQSFSRLMSIGRSLQIKPIFMKRSFSCNGKISLPISNRNRNPPMRSF